MKIVASILSGATNVERSTIRSFYNGLLHYYAARFNLSINEKTEHKLKKHHNIELVLSYDTEFTECDLAVIYGSTKERSAQHHVTKQNLLKVSKAHICIETPLLGRTVKSIADYDYYRIGINGFLYKQGIFHGELTDKTRLDLLKENLGFSFTGWRPNPQGHILLLTQLPGDASLRDQNHAEWLIETIRQVRNLTDQKILVRMHPALSEKGRVEFLNSMSPLLLKNYSNVEFNDGHSSTLQEDLSNAKVCVSYTSGSSIDSILAGVPVIAIDQGNFAYDISSNLITDIENPRMASHAEVTNWLNSLCNSQWSLKEMHQGLPQSQLMPEVEELLCMTL